MPQFEGQISGLPVKISLGNITLSGADAIIVPEFRSCASFGGVGGAIARSGAVKGMQDYDAFIQQNDKPEFGAVILTESGGHCSRVLLHVVSVGAGKEYEFSTIKECLFNALKVAEQNGVASIAAPALGTGAFGSLSGKQSAEAMMCAIDEFRQQGGKNIPVSFVIFNDQPAYDDFVAVLRFGSYKSANCAQVGNKDFDARKWGSGLAANITANRLKLNKDWPGGVN